MSQLNPEIRAAINAFDTDKARTLLRDALKEADAETFYLASMVALNDDQKRHFLQQALEVDPFHQSAHESLAKLRDTTAQVAALSVSPSPTAVQTSESQMVVAAEPSVVAAPVKQGALVTGHTKTPTNLYVIPTPASVVRTQLPQNAALYPFARDDMAEWYHVIYDSPTGLDVVGWIAASNIESFQINETVVNPMDIPISQFELNSRDDVLALISAKNKLFPMAWISVVQSILGAIIVLVSLLPCIISIALPLSPDSDLDSVERLGSFLCFGVSALAIASLGIFLGIRSGSNVKKRKAASPIIEQVKRLNTLQLSMRTDYEKMRDDQRLNAAMQSAMNLGSGLLQTAASRYIPDRKNINVSVSRGKGK